jgi:non-ribosomal peptide synthetase component F
MDMDQRKIPLSQPPNIDSVADNAKSIPIGNPLSNTQCILLDTFLQPVPVGVWANIIGGDGLAMGYLKRDALTKEVFIPHPSAQIKMQTL